MIALDVTYKIALRVSSLAFLCMSIVNDKGKV